MKVLIGCCKKKVLYPPGYKVSAARLYQGLLFRVQLDYARDVWRVPDRDIFVLSARYGLVGLWQPIEWYEEMLPASRRARIPWAECVCAQAVERFGVREELFILAGARYRDPLTTMLEQSSMGFAVSHPVPAGMGYGQQVKWFRQGYADE